MTERTSCFVIMPYSEESDSVYHSAISEALAAQGVLVLRADQMGRESITLRAHVEKAVRGADFIIADVTGKNPNVMYELGYARAYSKPLLLISRATRLTLPADLSDLLCIRYRLDRLDDLGAQIRRWADKAISELRSPRPEINFTPSKDHMTVTAEPESIADAIVRNARTDLSVVAGSLSLFSNFILPQLVDRVSSKVRVRIVTADPEGEYARLRSVDAGVPVGQYRSDMWQRIDQVARDHVLRESVEIRLTEAIIASSVYLGDQVAAVFPYVPGRQSRGSLAFMVAGNTHRVIYADYVAYFQSLWDRGVALRPSHFRVTGSPRYPKRDA